MKKCSRKSFFLFPLQNKVCSGQAFVGPIVTCFDSLPSNFILLLLLKSSIHMLLFIIDRYFQSWYWLKITSSHVVVCQDRFLRLLRCSFKWPHTSIMLITLWHSYSSILSQYSWSWSLSSYYSSITEFSSDILWLCNSSILWCSVWYRNLTSSSIWGDLIFRMESSQINEFDKKNCVDSSLLRWPTIIVKENGRHVPRLVL